MEEMELHKQQVAVLRLFKGVLLTGKLENETRFNVPSERALKEGVFISDKFSNEIIDEAIKQYGRNGEEANQTFHKSLFKVANEKLEKLYYEQLLHYFSTYGAEALGVYDADCVIVPKEKLEIPELQIDTNFIVISPLTPDEVKERIYTLITSGIALSRQTVQDIVTLSDYINIEDYSEGDNYFCKITNREVKSALCGKLGILPKRGDEFMRYFLAKICNKTLLIKDKETQRSISWADDKEILDLLNRYKEQYGLIPLAKVYNRFKPLFISMKRHPKDAIWNCYTLEEMETMKEINKIINRIMKLSKKYHQPMPENDLNHFIEWANNMGVRQDFTEVFKRKLKSAGVYNAIKIANYLNQVYYSSFDYSLYKVRNGRVFIKDKYVKPYLPMYYIELAKDVVADFISENIKGKTYYLPKNIDYKLPQSEKQYIGSIPFGTKVTFKKQPLLVGIHWCNVQYRDGEKRVDLDLRLSSDKYNLGWNSSYREGSDLIFTGDNTNAPLPKGASEFMYIGDKIEDTTFNFRINNYTHDVGPIPYEIIIGTADPEQVEAKGKDFVIDPNNIIARIPMEMELGKAEQIIGVLKVEQDKIDLIFTDLTTSNSIVSNRKDFEKKVREFTVHQEETQMRLAPMLDIAGAVREETNKTSVLKEFVLSEDGKLLTVEEADELVEKSDFRYTGDDIVYKKVEVPVDFDFSLEALTKDSFIKLLSETK